MGGIERSSRELGSVGFQPRAWLAIPRGAMLACALVGLIGSLGMVPSASAQDAAAISAKVVVCVDPVRAGESDYLLDQSGAVLGADCRVAGNGEYTIDLYESDTPVDDPGVEVGSETTGVDGTVSFTYGLSLPWVYLGQGEPFDGGRFSADVPVSAGSVLDFLVVNFVETDTGLPTAPVAAGPLGDTVVATATVLRCVNAARAGEVVFLDNEAIVAAQNELSACVPAVADGATVDLYVSPTANEDPGTLIAAERTDATGTVTFSAPITDPYVYVGLGDEKSLDTAVIAGQPTRFTVVQYVTALDTAIDVRVVTCAATAGSEPIEFMLGADLVNLQLQGCTGATAGEFTVSLYDSPTLSEDTGTFVLDVATDEGGYAGFTYIGGLPAIYAGIAPVSDGTVFSADIPATGDDLSLLIVVSTGADGAVSEAAVPVVTVTGDQIVLGDPSVMTAANPAAEQSPASTSQLVEAAPIRLGDPAVQETTSGAAVVSDSVPVTTLVAADSDQPVVVNTLPSTGVGTSAASDTSLAGLVAVATLVMVALAGAVRRRLLHPS